MRILTSIMVFLIFLQHSFVIGQEAPTIGTQVINGKDTMPSFPINEVVIFTRKEFSSYQEQAQFNKLKRNVQKVYPYAIMAAQIYVEMGNDMDEMKRNRQRKKYVRGMEKNLKSEFAKEIKSLNNYQGSILIKLINRETGNNCYKLIKDLKNPLVAFFWHKIGKIYGYDLKEQYDPEQNIDLEYIVRMLENVD